MGVIAAITPWNFPFLIACWKVAPALAAGNSVVLKPASLTPLTALLLGQLAQEAGLPDGVLQVLPGAGSEAGNALATAESRLAALSPLAVLERGYCVATDSSGAALTVASQAAPGDNLDLRLHRGALRAQVLLTTEDE